MENYVNKNADTFSEGKKKKLLDFWLAVLSRVKLQISCPQLAHKPPLIKLIADASGRKERELRKSS